MQPSSAAAERVFSLLKASFSDQQDSTLQNYLESSITLQHNVLLLVLSMFFLKHIYENLKHNVTIMENNQCSPQGV